MLSLKWPDLRCLVTGGAGFIGSHLVDELIGLGATVRVVDDLSRGKRENMAHCLQQIEFVEGDLADKSVVKKVLNDIDVCFHLAAVVGGVDFMNNHPAEISKSLLVDRNMIDGCRLADTERFLYTSTACAYPTSLQEADDAPALKEEDAFTHGVKPDSYYGWTKIMGEVTCRAYHGAYGMKISIVRPFNPYGPRDYFDPDSSHVIPALIKRALRREHPFTVWGDGDQSRAFQYVTDVAHAFPIALEKLPNAEPVNLGSPDAVGIRDLAEMILRLTRFQTAIVFDKSRPQGVKSRRADTSKALKTLGWVPQTTLEDGLRRTIDWYLTQPR